MGRHGAPTARRPRPTKRRAVRDATKRHQRDHRHDEIPHPAVVLRSRVPRRRRDRRHVPHGRGAAHGGQHRGETAHDDATPSTSGACGASISRPTSATIARVGRSNESAASFEGVLRNWQAAQVDGEEGRTRNSAMYSILVSEWPGVRGTTRGTTSRLDRDGCAASRVFGEAHVQRDRAARERGVEAPQ